MNVKKREKVIEKDNVNEIKNNEKLTELNIVRKNYVDRILRGDKYLKLFSSVQRDFFVNPENVDFKLLYKMNKLWNKFRILSYAEYYNQDDILKDDINEKEYENDEYLLRLYVDAYNSMFETIIDDFVTKYEYANGTAVDLYEIIENSLNTLGKPIEKFIILEKIYNKMQVLGGSEVVLKSILEKEDYKNEEAEKQELESLLSNIQSDNINDDNVSEDSEKDIIVENVDSVPVNVIDEDALKNDMETIENVANTKETEKIVNGNNEDFQEKEVSKLKQDENTDNNEVEETEENNPDNEIENSNPEEIEYIEEELEISENQ